MLTGLEANDIIVVLFFIVPVGHPRQDPLLPIWGQRSEMVANRLSHVLYLVSRRGPRICTHKEKFHYRNKNSAVNEGTSHPV